MATRMPVGINISSAMVISISGEVDLNNCAKIEAMFASFFSLGVKDWLIDLRGVGYFDSDGIKLLERCFSKAKGEGGRVAIICHQTGLTARILSLSGVAQEVKCFTDMASAVGFVGLG